MKLGAKPPLFTTANQVQKKEKSGNKWVLIVLKTNRKGNEIAS